MNARKNSKMLPAVTVIALCGMMSFAYQNCARAKFTIDPAAKSEALGKESVFDRQAGDDGVVGGSQPGNDGAVPGGKNPPGDDANTGGKNPNGNDPNMPQFPGMGNDPNMPKFPGSGNDPNMPKFPGMGNDPNMPGMPTTGNDPSVPGKNPNGNDPSMPGKNPNGNDPNVPKTNVPVNFVFECSNVHSNAAGGNVLTSSALKVVIVDRSNKVVCELTGDFRSQILNTKKIAFTPCADLAPGKYEAHVMDANVASSSFLMKELTQDDITFTKNADGTYTTNGRKIEILYDFNNQNSQYADMNKKYGNTSTADSQAKCDSRVSPLIVSMNSQSRGIKLTSPLDGIQFDILGENSFPKAHDKKQISWLATDEQEYYFIVLPNKNGQVLGINEMFGDNTRGPDGKFSANGYAALAKYDDDKDALITDEDAVYSELRLWNDRNRDGIADPNELYTLKEKGLSVIDLHYDKRYKETDQYGNQTLMKSVVKTEDGKLHLMFDLWFRYLNITK